MKDYDHKAIEKKWQEEWEKRAANAASDSSEKPTYYCLIEFPYPSGDGLHIGHIRSNTAMDIIARKRRAEGFDVLYPIGWDAFGLPTENYAIKTGVQPAVATKKNTDTFRRQLKALGFSFDWAREINTTDPSYYKWTQWIFLQFLKKDLAYKKKMTINWCPKDKIGLANEEVINGCCERCGTQVEKREKEQWMLAITKYADRLDTDLDSVDFLEKIKIQQRNWIGKSEGAEINFEIRYKKKTDTKPNYLILHGFEGGADKNFIPWLKSELEKQGAKVQSPQMPNANNPKEVEQVDFVLKNCHIDEQTIIIGHSLGCVVAMKLVQKIGKPIAGLVLVAPAVDPQFHKASTPRPFWKTFTWDIDYEKLKKLTNFRTVLSDTQEQGRALYLKFLAEKLDASFEETKAVEEHFCDKREPFILRVLSPRFKVFTTRADTLFGATYLVLSPEHPWVKLATDDRHDVLVNKEEVKTYVLQAGKKTEIERTSVDREKTGVELKGITAVNPANNEEIPVFVADYVLSDYGTGAIMAVPAHDQRDFQFAQKYKLPIREVVIPVRIDKRNPPVPGKKTVERKNVHVIVKNPKTGKVIILKWKNHPWITFPMGGIEEGESILEAAKREVTEETGYTDLLNGKVHGGPVRAEYFAAHKDENRVAYTSLVTFDLGNEKREPLQEKESAAHEIIWEDMSKLTAAYMTHAEMDVWLERLSTNSICFAEEGELIDSGAFTGLTSAKAQKNITEDVGGRLVTTYKLRDWIFSRQRYWGEPIPVVHCKACGVVPVPEQDLPITLPEVASYQPTDTGESPLAAIESWVNVQCPNCKGKAKRETDTMPNWAGSSWYFLRYTDPHNSKVFADPKKLERWIPVDWYNGGMEHTTLHLLYSRFWHKFLFDLGLVPTAEPYQKRTSHGLILAEGGVKMSKSKGNVVNPDTIVGMVGADALRLYEMFMGPFDQAIAWSEDGVVGTRRFIERVWRLCDKMGEITPSRELENLLNKTIQKVSDDIEVMKFNTAVSSLMILTNALEKEARVARSHYEILLRLLAPFIPHVTEELWSELGHKNSIHLEGWPIADQSKMTATEVTLAIQINGKVRGEIVIPAHFSEQEVRTRIENEPTVAKWVEGKVIKKFIYVPGRLANIVV